MPIKRPRIDAGSNRDLAIEDGWSREVYGDGREGKFARRGFTGRKGESGLSRGRKAAAKIAAGRRFFPPGLRKI